MSDQTPTPSDALAHDLIDAVAEHAMEPVHLADDGGPAVRAVKAVLARHAPSSSLPDSGERERGDRLYDALAIFDVRNGSPLACIVRAAREGWERSAPEMAEPGAWDEFDRLMEERRVGLAALREHGIEPCSPLLLVEPSHPADGEAPGDACDSCGAPRGAPPAGPCEGHPVHPEGQDTPAREEEASDRRCDCGHLRSEHNALGWQVVQVGNPAALVEVAKDDLPLLPSAPDGDARDPFPGVVRPASRAHLRLTVAVLAALEAGLDPATIRRFVAEELPPAPDEGPDSSDAEVLSETDTRVLSETDTTEEDKQP